MQTMVQWCDWNGKGLDQCWFSQSRESLILEGVVIDTRERQCGAYYFVRADARFRTREVRFGYVGGPRLHVETDGEGHWHDLLTDRPIPSLDGCLDVDMGVTPATNTLPIKRLKLKEQASQDIDVAYVPLPSQLEGDFLPQLEKQRYSCLVPNRRFRYEGIFGTFTAEIEVDEYGLVLDYPEMFRRVDASRQ